MTPAVQSEFDATALHEAAHAVVMFAVGVRIARAYILPPPPPSRNYGQPGGVTPATEPTLEQGVLIGLAGSLVEHRPLTLSRLLHQYRAGDIATVDDEVRKFFLAVADAARQQPPDELVAVFVHAYVRQRFEALKPWLLRDASRSAVNQVADALKTNAMVGGSLAHEDVAAICEAFDIRPVPFALRSGRKAMRLSNVRRWPWSQAAPISA